MTRSFDDSWDRSSLCLKNRDTGEVFMPDTEEISLGRSGQCDVVITEDMAVSRVHASMVIIGETASIRDLGSANGVFVNDKRIISIAMLYSGDEVRIGTTSFVMVPLAILTSIEFERVMANKAKPKPPGSSKCTQQMYGPLCTKHLELLTYRQPSK